MKRTLAILVAILLIAVSVFPAFAENVNSPKATTGNYQVVIVPGPGGGSFDFDYKTPVGDDGKQTIHFSAKPDDGYVFTGWTFEGDYTTSGKLTDADIDIIANGDIKATPHFAKIGEDETKPANPKVDDSTKSPKTGSDSLMYVGFASLALIGLLFAAKKCFYKK